MQPLLISHRKKVRNSYHSNWNRSRWRTKYCPDMDAAPQMKTFQLRKILDSVVFSLAIAERGPGMLFQTFWHGNALSPYEMACMRSFLDHGHSYDLYTYRGDLRVPAGIECRDAASLIAPEEYFTYEPATTFG